MYIHIHTVHIYKYVHLPWWQEKKKMPGQTMWVLPGTPSHLWRPCGEMEKWDRWRSSYPWVFSKMRTALIWREGSSLMCFLCHRVVPPTLWTRRWWCNFLTTFLLRHLINAGACLASATANPSSQNGASFCATVSLDITQPLGGQMSSVAWQNIWYT